MKWLVTVLGVVGIAGVWLATSNQAPLEAGIILLLAADFAAFWAFVEIVRTEGDPSCNRLRAKRELIFAYEFLILGFANVLALPHTPPIIATVGSAILIAGQSLILWLVLKSPRIVRPVERLRSKTDLSARAIIVALGYATLVVVGAAVYVSRFGPTPGAVIPVKFQWPGITLLYAALGCLTLGLASERSLGSVPLYVAVAFVVIASVGFEFLGTQDWYFLGLSLFAFLCLVPGWPPPLRRGASQSPLNGATQTGQ